MTIRQDIEELIKSVRQRHKHDCSTKFYNAPEEFNTRYSIYNNLPPKACYAIEKPVTESNNQLFLSRTVCTKNISIIPKHGYPRGYQKKGIPCHSMPRASNGVIEDKSTQPRGQRAQRAWRRKDDCVDSDSRNLFHTKPNRASKICLRLHCAKCLQRP